MYLVSFVVSIKEEPVAEVEEIIIIEEVKVIDKNPCTAKIESISSLGEVLIRFNEKMAVERANITQINSTNADLYITPVDHWHLDYESFNMSKLNFTWNTTEYANDYLKLKLYFIEPLYISPLFKYDHLEFHLKNGFNSVFVCQEKLSALHGNYTSLIKPIQK